MAHKDWDPDDFLNEFLDFDYKKPVPGNEERISGLPSDNTPSAAHQNNKSYGLEDDYKLYSSLRAGRDKNAGTQPTVQKEQQGLRSSGAIKADIPEPLSAKRSLKEIVGSHSGSTQTLSAGDDGGDKIAAGERSRLSSVLSDIRNKGSHIHASELASDAIHAAKKLVESEEDVPPEVIPPVGSAGNSAPGSAAGSGHRIGAGIENGSGNASDSAKNAGVFGIAPPLGDRSSKAISSEENKALKQAQQDAYERYHSNYDKNYRKKYGSARIGAFPKWLSRIYAVALVAFCVVMGVLNVLPFGALIALYIVLGLLSVIILIQLRKKNEKKLTRGLASVTAILLILVFGVGTAYSMGTLSFLDVTSVENANKVASITKQPFNICITGIDVDGTIDEEGRSDVNMIVTVNPVTEQILMTSIPRDYEIYMPDKDNAMDKLTHTGFYGVNTTIGAEENLFDITINYYVKVNFTTVEKFVDAIDGVDVYSEYEFTPVKLKSWTVQEGWNHMDGQQALAFARERKAFLTGDNQRIKNQQAVFEAMIKKATSSRTMLMSYNKILSSLRDYFQMSFSSSELRSLLKLQLSKNPEWQIYRNTVTGGDGSMQTYSTGSAYAYVMTQDQESIENARTLINAVLNGQTLARDDDDNVYVEGGEDAGESEETEG